MLAEIEDPQHVVHVIFAPYMTLHPFLLNYLQPDSFCLTATTMFPAVQLRHPTGAMSSALARPDLRVMSLD